MMCVCIICVCVFVCFFKVFIHAIFVCLSLSENVVSVCMWCVYVVWMSVCVFDCCVVCLCVVVFVCVCV